MDDADLAQIREEALIASAMAARSPRLKSPDSLCVWCKDEQVIADTAFCSAECGEDYHKYQREVKQRITGE